MKEILEWVATNWSVILGVICVIAVVIVAVVRFMKLPSATQQAKIKECLLAWVVEAERDLGGGTGAVKLRTVYGWFVTAFPFLKNFVPFETFSGWVDEALETMREMLKENENLKQVIESTPLVVVTTTNETETE